MMMTRPATTSRALIGFGVACVQAWVSPASALVGVFVVAVSIVVAALIMSAGERDSA